LLHYTTTTIIVIIIIIIIIIIILFLLLLPHKITIAKSMSCCGLRIGKQHSVPRIDSDEAENDSPEQKWPDEEKELGLFGDSPAKAQELTYSQIDDVWREVHALERQNLASSRYRHVGRTFEPVIDFFTRFSPMVDSMIQYGSRPSTLVWGALKGVLMVRS
jgi:hypothetical protein